MEYLLILAFIVTGTVQISKRIITSLDQGTVNIGAQMEKDLKSGRAPLSVWQN